MPFAPKDQSTILRNLLSLVINRTELNDVAPGSILYTLMAGISNEMAATERRLANIRDSFFIENVSGSELDERVAELPLSGLSRRGESAASGACVTITRDNSNVGQQLIISAGSKVAAPVNGLTYSILQDVIFEVGETIVENVFVRADVAGIRGNVQSGQITQPIAMPAEVISITNTQPLTNGQFRESDSSLRRRASKYLESLARVQPTALEYLALSFEPSDGSKFSFASIFEDPDRPAYSELLVDDGSGLTVESVSRSGRPTTATVPASGQFLLYHEAPAIEAITGANISVNRGGGVFTLNDSDITSIPERGIVYLPENLLQPGDVWTISNYKVFAGPIGELQAEIEGNNSDSRISGFRAAGCRVRVLPPETQLIRFDIALAPDPSFDFAIVEYKAKQAALGYIATLGINDILYTSRLIDQVLTVDGVVDVEILQSGQQQRLANIYPRNKRTILRTNDSLIGVSSRIILED